MAWINEPRAWRCGRCAGPSDGPICWKCRVDEERGRKCKICGAFLFGDFERTLGICWKCRRD